MNTDSMFVLVVAVLVSLNGKSLPVEGRSFRAKVNNAAVATLQLYVPLRHLSTAAKKPPRLSAVHEAGNQTPFFSYSIDVYNSTQSYVGLLQWCFFSCKEGSFLIDLVSSHWVTGRHPSPVTLAPCRDRCNPSNRRNRRNRRTIRRTRQDRKQKWIEVRLL